MTPPGGPARRGAGEGGAGAVCFKENKLPKLGSGDSVERLYCVFECPHCEAEIDVPESSVVHKKGNACKAHLATCPNYTPTAPKETDFAAENLRLKQLLQDKRPAKRARPETMVIYALLLEGNFVYTGKTANPDARLGSHASRSSQCRLVRNAFKKHGRAKFTLKVLMRCSADPPDTSTPCVGV